jgi:hypothetical protein
VSLSAARAIVDLMNGNKPENVLNPVVYKSGALRAAISS